ncbi:MAG: glycosyltransferase family 9 protein [Planctomycetota bacterium]|jgi:lipopolysaccharide heptosyltransferase I
MPNAFKKILIIKPSSLGDIVLALPALTALRESFPEAAISWLVRPEFAPLLENHPHLNTIIQFDRKLLGKAWYHPHAFTALLSFISTLRRNRFDLVFDFQGLFRTAALARLSGCKKRFGKANARELGHIFYSHKIVQDYNCAHLVDYYLKMVRAAGASESQAQFLLPVNPSTDESVRRMLDAHGIDPDNYAVLVAGSARTEKCWPVERFAALADKIAAEFGLSIVAVGTAPEKAIVDRLQELANVPVANFAGLTTLVELVALLRTAKLAVSNDTGPGHIAAALGIPLVLIFGPTNPARVGPYARSNCAAAVEPNLRGLHINSPDPKHNVNAVTVDDVYQKICPQMKA